MVVEKGHLIMDSRAELKLPIGSSIYQGADLHLYRPEEAAEIAGKMLGHKLSTKQTGAQGRPCNRVFVVEPVSYSKEFYLAILLDRQSQVPSLNEFIISSYLFVGSPCGWVLSGWDGH